MGRHERPLDPDAGPVEAFAHALRELRVAVGMPRYRELARKAGYSASALSAAASGAALPSLDLVLSYVGACGGDAVEWEAQWRAVSAVVSRSRPASRPVLSVPHDQPSADAAAGPDSPDRVPVLTGEPVFQNLTAGDPRQAGPYRLRVRIAVGSMGRVYLAYTPAGRPLAIKIVRPELAEDAEFRQRFRREVDAARQVHGLFTAQVLDADTAAPHPWLATAYVAGPSVQEAVTECGPLPSRSLWLFAAGVAEALQSVQAAGVVHRDLKPTNVLLAADGPRLIDFGIARASDASRLTRTGIRIGSPQFMAPEHVLGGEASLASDVFTLGALIVFAATGRTPFGDGVDVAVLYRVVHEPPDLAGLPEDLQSIAAACLNKKAHQRPDLASVIKACRVQSGFTSLKISSNWLPDSHTAQIHRHVAALQRV
ncbi:MAG TPA: serine/threonine-protein kinase [Pseudonocardiaceae bacterium]|nr:serine/threonine-protein kinase [Pseudonocardiaceae bacterium]